GVGDRRYSTAAWCSRPAFSTNWPCPIAWPGAIVFLATTMRSATSASSDSMRFGALPDGGGVTATAAHICPCVVSCADACAAAAVNKAKASSEDFMSIPLNSAAAPQPHFPCQNTSLRLTCNCRMLMLELRLVIVPKPPLPGIGTPPASRWSAAKPLFGLPKLGWLKALKASSRNCSLSRSVNLISFLRERSTLNNGGPITVFRPRFPNVYCDCRAKACTLNHSRGVGLLSCTDWPATAFGRSMLLLPILDRSWPSMMSTGEPVAMDQITPRSHPPAKALATRPFMSLWPFPNGNW